MTSALPSDYNQAAEVLYLRHIIVLRLPCTNELIELSKSTHCRRYHTVETLGSRSRTVDGSTSSKSNNEKQTGLPMDWQDPECQERIIGFLSFKSSRIYKYTEQKTEPS
jgi:hypothetical protein